jgi:hypothetical protein
LTLKNRFYIGEVAYKGEHYPGLHEPILSRELFEGVQPANGNEVGVYQWRRDDHRPRACWAP